MTSKLTRDRLAEIAQFGFSSAITPANDFEIKELARLVLYAMGSDQDRNPVLGYADSYRDMAKQGVESVPIWSVITDLERNIAPLYRHAQQAPASEPVYQYWCYTTVENSEGDPEEFWFWKDCEKGFYDRWKNAKRTLYKTPQPALVVPDEIKHRIGGLDWGWEGEFNRGWNACRAAMLQAGNSPAQSDCCPAQNDVAPAQSPIDHGYLPECECSGCKATARICAELAGNSQVIPDGYVMVPKEPTEAMMLHNSGCQHHAWDDRDCAMRQTRRLIWSHMLAAAPQLPGSEPATVPGTWIPVNERLPEAGGDMIVFTDGIVMSGVSYAKKKGFYIQALEYDDDEPVDSVTHWMPLPAAPQEVKDAHH